MTTRAKELAALLRLVPWRKAVIAEATRRLAAENPGHENTISKMVMKRVDLLECALAGSEWTGDQGPFLVDDGVLLTVGPRLEARRAAKSLFFGGGSGGSSSKSCLERLLDAPPLLDKFEWRGEQQAAKACRKGKKRR